MTRILLVIAFLVAFSLAFVAGTDFVRDRRTAQLSVAAAPQASTSEPAKAPDEAKAEAQDDDADQGPAWPQSAGSPEQVMYAQPQLMDAALKKLLPRTPGKPNLYLIAFAGDGDENVFRNEVDFVQSQFERRFGAAGHTIALINNPETLEKQPLATLTNLATAVTAAAERMDSQQDILFVFLTSHGSAEHELYVGMDPLALDQITPDDLADIFTTSSVRNKVIVISACYSGGFIDALKDSSTLVITASRSDRASFGCGTDSPITDFSRAFFVGALNQGNSFTEAYAQAAKQVDAQETRDDETHSFPQIASAEPIEKKLAEWRATLAPAPPVPFNPTMPESSPSNSEASKPGSSGSRSPLPATPDPAK